MLFDLQSGKRRRVVQVVFGALALLFLSQLRRSSGSAATRAGGIFDALGLGGDNSPSTGNPQFDEQIEDAEDAGRRRTRRTRRRCSSSPRSATRRASSSSSRTPRPASRSSPRTRGRTSRRALDAWEQYIDLEPKKPDPSTAALVAQAYVQLEDAQGAAEAQRIVAEDNPCGGTYGNLAFYLYASGDIEGGDEAAALAVENSDPAQADQIKKQLAQVSEQAAKLKKAAAKAAEQADKDGQPGGRSDRGPVRQPGRHRRPRRHRSGGPAGSLAAGATAATITASPGR